MKARTTASLLAALFVAGACQSESEWRPTDAEESSLRDTLLTLAQQPPAFPGADVSTMKCYWVHPEVALLWGSLSVPTSEGDTVETTSTLVFILTEEGWRFQSATGRGQD